MKRPIAMRMTQEQFDSIKDRITLPIELNSDDFETYCWVTNDRNEEGIVANLPFPNNGRYEREIHETFNADIFLEACGDEVEKVWKSEEMQSLSSDGIWIDCIGGRKFRFKPQPDYSKEIEALKQKAKENGMSVELIWSKL